MKLERKRDMEEKNI